MPRRRNTTGYVPGVKGGKKGTVRRVGKPAPTTDIVHPKGSPENVPGRQTTSPPASRARPRRAKRRARASKERERQIARALASLREKRRSPKTLVTDNPPKPPPESKPALFRSQPTAGTPTLASLQAAAKTGTLKLNKKGFITTPPVRKAARELKLAKKVAPKAKHDVGGIEDPQIRKAIVRHAPKVDKLAKQSYGLSGEALLSKLVEGESNEEMGAVSTASAKSITQFIPQTRADFVNRLGVDPWKNKNSAVKAATMHLDGKHGYPPGLEGYNPKGGQGYVDYILGQPSGGAVRTGKGMTPRLRQAVKQAKALGLKRQGPPSPKKVSRFKAAQKAAETLEKMKLPYVWGGGHNAGKVQTGSGLDCSGAVSYVLQRMGVKLPGGVVSGAMGSYVKPGPGAVTVFYNPGHTFMRIGNRYFGTSRTNPGGGAGFIPGSVAGPEAKSGKYSVGHVAGLDQKVALQLGVASSFPGMSVSSGGTSAQVTSGGALLRKPGFSKKPISPEQRAQRTLRKLLRFGAGVGASSTPEVSLAELERKYGSPAV